MDLAFKIFIIIWAIVWAVITYLEQKRQERIDILLDTLFDIEEDDRPEKLFEASGAEQVTHLSCNKCGYDWWSVESFPNYCPHCGNKRN